MLHAINSLFIDSSGDNLEPIVQSSASPSSSIAMTVLELISSCLSLVGVGITSMCKQSWSSLVAFKCVFSSESGFDGSKTFSSYQQYKYLYSEVFVNNFKSCLRNVFYGEFT